MDQPRWGNIESGQLIGIGLYTIPDAARYTRVNGRRIRRWVKGYTYSRDSKKRHSAPIVEHDVEPIGSDWAVSFLDLIEIRFIDAFRDFGVSWRSIKVASERAREILQTPHPFASHKFKTDGKTIFAELADSLSEKRGRKDLLDLVKDQYAIPKIIQKSLLKNVEFDGKELAARWWPHGKRNEVVLDPNLSFGNPIVAEECIQTLVLADAYAAEKSYERVARWYDVRVAAVKKAVKYEADPNP